MSATAGNFVTIRQEGNFIIVDTPEDSDGGEMTKGLISNYAISGDSLRQVSYEEKLTGIKNSHWDLQLLRQQEKIQKEERRALKLLQDEAALADYDYRVMRMDKRWNDLELLKRSNPSLDTTYDEKVMLQSTHYLKYNPQHCSYTDRSTTIPLRITSTPGDLWVSPTVAKARHLMQLRDIDKQVVWERERHHRLKSGGAVLSKSVQFQQLSPGSLLHNDDDEVFLHQKGDDTRQQDDGEACMQLEQNQDRPACHGSRVQRSYSSSGEPAESLAPAGIGQGSGDQDRDPDFDDAASVKSDSQLARHKVLARSYSSVGSPWSGSDIIGNMIITPQASDLWVQPRPSPKGTRSRHATRSLPNLQKLTPLKEQQPGQFPLLAGRAHSATALPLTNNGDQHESTSVDSTSPAEVQGSNAIAKLRSHGIIPPPLARRAAKPLLGTRPPLLRSQSMYNRYHSNGYTDMKVLHRERTAVDDKLRNYFHEMDMRKAEEERQARTPIMPILKEDQTRHLSISTSVTAMNDNKNLPVPLDENTRDQPSAAVPDGDVTTTHVEQEPSTSQKTASISHVSELLIPGNAMRLPEGSRPTHPETNAAAYRSKTLEMRTYVQTKGRLLENQPSQLLTRMAATQNPLQIKASPFSRQRSHKHTATSRLQKMLAERRKTQTTQQLMAMDKIRNNLQSSGKMFTGDGHF